MTPKEKYQELFTKFNDAIPPNYSKDIDDSIALDIKATEKCILIAVDEIINIACDESDYDISVTKTYWQEVKQEIEKL